MPGKQNVPHVKRSSAETIQRIVSAARTEFGMKGFEGARIQTIARGSGKTKQLIQHYYGSKESLYRSVVSDLTDDGVRAQLNGDYESLPPRDAFLAFMTNLFELYRQHPEMPAVILDESLRGGAYIDRHAAIATAPIVSQFRRILVKGAAEGVFRDVEDCEFFLANAAMMLAGCLFVGSLFSRYIPVDLTSPEGQTRCRDHVLGMLLDSLRPNFRGMGAAS